MSQLVEQTFGYLTVLHHNGDKVICRCKCGNITTIIRSNWGRTKSCGCLRRIIKDLTGTRFGNLIVINQTGINKHRQSLWRCRCNCGNEIITTGNRLLTGNTSSCGCSRANKLENLIGKTFGNWTIINRAAAPLKNGEVPWLCRCNCQSKTIRSISRFALLSGNTISCGCAIHPISKWEKKVAAYITAQVGNENILTNTIISGRLRPDIIIPDKKLIIECNGLHWHSAIAGSIADDKWQHYNRRVLFESLGYRAIFLWEDDWLYHRQATEHYLANIINPKKFPVYNARDLEVVEIYYNEVAIFMNKYHMQGMANGKTRWLGLVNGLNLVGCMGFAINSRPILYKKYSVELIRYASIGRIRGGASRLLHHFLDENWGINSVVSFSDNDYFTGNMYSAVGFTLNKELAPDYYSIFNHRRYHKSFTKRANLLKLAQQNKIIFDPDTMTEVSCLNYNKIRRVWNSGRKCWILNRD